MDRKLRVPAALQGDCKSARPRDCSHLTGRAAPLPQPPGDSECKDELAKNWSHSIQSPKLSNNETALPRSCKGMESPVLSLNAEFKNPGPVPLLPTTNKESHFSHRPDFPHPFTFL